MCILEEICIINLTNILKECSRNKGIEMVGVIDTHAPGVLAEIEKLIEERQAAELADGGVRFEHVTLILGTEIEVYDEFCKGPIHVLCYFPTIHVMREFSNWLATKMSNINLSSQRYYGTAKDLQYKVKELSGLFIPAHVFTPFKSLYGKGINQTMKEVLDPDLIDAIELGLSADTRMADQISELHNYTFITNSDAHSLPKIAREYQQLLVKDASFKELEWALHHVEGRRVTKNFGMNPRLGKYHTTVCSACLQPAIYGEACAHCGSRKIIKGVSDRIKELTTATETPKRPPYIHQVPLEYLPKLGPKTFQKLLTKFGTEMNVIHHAPFQELESVVGEKLAKAITDMRVGKLSVEAGGGGRYGKITSS